MKKNTSHSANKKKAAEVQPAQAPIAVPPPAPVPVPVPPLTPVIPIGKRFSDVSAKLDGWLSAHSIWVEALIVAAGGILRLMDARGTYLNPDEALHYIIAHQTSPWGVYKASLTNAHPPFYFLFLYFWRFIGSSELILRLPSVLAGTALIGVVGRWLSTAVGKTTGLAAILIIAFSPPLIALSAEVRGYSILLLWMALSLYCLQRAFQSDSARWIVRYSIFLLLAILTHYSALWFTITLGVYVLLRLRDFSGRARTLWAAFQIAAAALYAVLYKTHVSQLQTSVMQQQMTDGWLRVSYYQPGAGTPFGFVKQATTYVFQFLFAHLSGGLVAMALFAGGIVWLIAASLRGREQALRPWTFAVLLTLPFFVTALAAVMRLYPYGGTRHDVFLIIFAIAGISLTIAAAVRQRMWPVLMAAAVVLPLCYRYALPMPPALAFDDQRSQRMEQAVSFFHSAVAAGSLVFVDYQSNTLAAYYLGRNEIPVSVPGRDIFEEETIGPNRFIISPAWVLDGSTYPVQLARLRTAYHLKPSDPIWVFAAGWGVNLLDQISPGAAANPSFAKHFGRSISVFQPSQIPQP